MRAAAIITAAMLCGCISRHGVEVVQTDPRGWRGAVEISFETADTAARCNIDMLVRYLGALNESRYALRFTAPDSTFLLDTLRVAAEGMTDDRFHEKRIPYRRNALLSQRGVYTLSIKPVREVPTGITAVGIIVK